MFITKSSLGQWMFSSKEKWSVGYSLFQKTYYCIMISILTMIWQQIVRQIVTYNNCSAQLQCYPHGMIIIWFHWFFCEGYYKAAALTTDKLLQEHQEVNVSKLCLFYLLMTGVPINGYKVLISTALVGDCGRHVGLMVNVLYSGASSPGSSRGQGHNVLCS